ncbi:MAG: hypothetical protein R3B70_28805 [Polyangiaceae bacterium]
MSFPVLRAGHDNPTVRRHRDGGHRSTGAVQRAESPESTSQRHSAALRGRGGEPAVAGEGALDRFIWLYRHLTLQIAGEGIPYTQHPILGRRQQSTAILSHRDARQVAIVREEKQEPPGVGGLRCVPIRLPMLSPLASRPRTRPRQ